MDKKKKHPKGRSRKKGAFISDNHPAEEAFSSSSKWMDSNADAPTLGQPEEIIIIRNGVGASVVFDDTKTQARSISNPNAPLAISTLTYATRLRPWDRARCLFHAHFLT